MRRLDISMPLFPGMPMFPGDPEMAVTSLRALERGDPYNLSGLTLGSLTGTHIDPPVHFFRDGASADRVDLDALNGPCLVVDAGARTRSIGPDLVSQLPPRTERVLFRTANSTRWSKSLEFFPDYVGLTRDAADALAHRRVRLVGIDALSIENDPSEAYPVHRTLLGQGAVILEGILLSEVSAGEYQLECLPLPLRDGDGAPARATLLAV